MTTVEVIVERDGENVEFTITREPIGVVPSSPPTTPPSKTRGSGLNHPVLISKCYTAFASQQSKVYSVQRDVICSLQSLGLRPKSEVLTKHGFRVDATVVVEGRIVGIEVILRRHVIGDKPSNHKPTGGTLIKRRQLAKVEKIKLVSIPYYEWDALGHHGSAVRAKKQDYLLSILGLKN